MKANYNDRDVGWRAVAYNLAFSVDHKRWVEILDLRVRITKELPRHVSDPPPRVCLDMTHEYDERYRVHKISIYHDTQKLWELSMEERTVYDPLSSYQSLDSDIATDENHGYPKSMENPLISRSVLAVVRWIEAWSHSQSTLSWRPWWMVFPGITPGA